MIRIPMSAALGATVVAFAWWQDVPTAPTVEDRAAVLQMLAPTYEDEISLIANVQRRVLEASRGRHGIPKGQAREPADLLQAASGLCFDRSRTIEKALAQLGFDVRHVSVYQSASAALMPGIGSHALSEVRTSRGWMLVDSITTWLGLDETGAPVSAAGLREAASLRSTIPDESGVLRGDFVHVVGLYSRHGMFYEPYTPIPDVNWRQLLENFSE